MIGTTIDHYKITDEIGRGGMGVVYRAKDTLLKRDVAVKMLPDRFTRDRRFKKRFFQEARVASALDHPSICTIHNIGETADGQLYIIMAFYRGQTLAARLRRGCLLPPQALRFARQIAAGLERAHEAGIIHRDIKPANLMITERDEIKILDFGLAKLAGQVDLTQPGSLIGTVCYMSPQQAEGLDVDHRADIWALGVVLYEMLTGLRPFDGKSMSAIIQAIAFDEPSFPNHSVAPAPVVSILRNMLAKDLPRRYASARALIADLEVVAVSPSGDAVLIDDATVTRLTVPALRPKRSILVLPFSNLSPDGENDYFGDGLTDEIITDLSGVTSLRVISRTSANVLKNSTKSLRQIAAELGVEYVLEGSVRRSGSALRMTAKLIEATTDSTLWAHKYGGTLKDVFAIQESVSREIVTALELQLSDSENEWLADKPISDVSVYDCYLQAKQSFLRYSQPGLEAAERALRQALDSAGENVLILSALGKVYWQYVNAGISDDPRYLRKARECADKIRRLDPESPHGKRLLGMVLMHEGDLQQAFHLLKGALEHHPNDTDTLVMLIPSYGFIGRPYAGMPWVERLLEIDPLTPMHQYMPGLLALMAGIYDRAEESFKKSYSMDPENPIVRLTYGQALALNEHRADAIEVFDSMERDGAEGFFTALGQAYKFALLGDRDRTHSALNAEVRNIARADLFHAWNLAQCHALLGERTEAADCLEHAVARGLLNHPLLSKLDPFLDDLRGEPRFEGLMDRLKVKWDSFEV